MSIKIIGAGVGRTGTYSLKLALNQLGLGQCHHMEEVLHNMPVQVPLWTDAVKGRPNWDAIFTGYESAVDWPTAGFYRELNAVYPNAKFILTHRSPESWIESFSSTIQKFVDGAVDTPKEDGVSEGPRRGGSQAGL
jgi:Sulfotransferase domain